MIIIVVIINLSLWFKELNIKKLGGARTLTRRNDLCFLPLKLNSIGVIKSRNSDTAMDKLIYSLG